MTFLLNGKPVDALALIVHADNAANIGRRWVDKLCTRMHSSLTLPLLSPL